MLGYYGFPEYVPVAQKRARAAKKLAALKKKNPGIQPVLIEGRALARTWWGKSWNQNLERYADYSNRIGRGRSYVRHGAVLDLQIEPGKIRALVQGSQSRPYRVAISIKPLDKTSWKRVREAAGGQLDSLAELLAGKFPKPLQEAFFSREDGLFPNPKEIGFDCSCPDWASMCKHVAAALYGVGARLDEDPSLFFKLRQIKMDDLITQAVKSTSQALLKKAETRSSRVLEGTNLTDVFGIKLDEEIDLESAPPKDRKKRTARASKKSGSRIQHSSTKPAKRAGGQTSGKTTTKRKAPAKPRTKSARKSIPGRKLHARAEKSWPTPAGAASGTFIDLVISAIPKRRKTIRVADICARVDLSERQVRNAVTRAVAQGRLKTTGRGIYARP